MNKKEISREEQLSALLDSQLDRRQAQAVLDELLDSPELTRQWADWHLEHDVLSGQAAVRSSFMQQLHEALESEPVCARQRRRIARAWLAVSAGLLVLLLGFWWVQIASTPAQPDFSARPHLARATQQQTVQAYVLAHQESAGNPLYVGEAAAQGWEAQKGQP